jgi:hypothetical protein
LPQRPLEPCHRLGLTRGHDFDSAIVKVLDRAPNPFEARRVAGELAIADSLHASSDEETFTDEHER